jgi:hypothetical protein
VRVIVIVPALTAYAHCRHCEAIFDGADVARRTHHEMMEEYPEDVRRAYGRVCEWVAAAAVRYGDRIRIRILDPLSPEGALVAIRHRVRTYPTVIVNGREKFAGWQEGAVDAALARLLPAPADAPAGA